MLPRIDFLDQFGCELWRPGIKRALPIPPPLPAGKFTKLHTGIGIVPGRQRIFLGHDRKIAKFPKIFLHLTILFDSGWYVDPGC